MKIVCVLLLCLGCSNVLAWTLTGSVLYVDSGDLVTVRDTNGFHHQVRLRGIDAPAMNDRFGKASRDALSSEVTGRFVVVDYQDRDRARSVMGTVRISGEDMNLRQLYAGLARFDPTVAAGLSGSERDLYARAEGEAKDNQRGMWAGAGGTPSEERPWRPAFPSDSTSPWRSGWGDVQLAPDPDTYPEPWRNPGPAPRPEPVYPGAGNWQPYHPWGWWR
ncbi:MAG: thermonuclease family protein [Pseudomonadota bacterium]|nr:thermonuclease family protein [Pseudomonadota bacterium]